MKISAPLTSEPHPVLQRIEVASSFSIPSFHLIGLAGPEVSEARERVRAAIEASGFEFPKRRVVVNLSPASLRKRGTGADLAIALAILDSVPDAPQSFQDIVAWGELGLDGKVKPAGKLMRGIWAAWDASAQLMLVSIEEEEKALEAIALLEETGEFKAPPPTLIGVTHLSEAWIHIKENVRPPRLSPKRRLKSALTNQSIEPDKMKLTPQLARLVGVAASGQHHMILLGPRGSGKSHALEWLLALQPKPTARLLAQQQLVAELSGNPALKNYRRVGSQCRPAALIGGCSSQAIRPGEFSLAHGGVLIADELPEWSRDSREALREPLERRHITLTRTEGSLELPAKFTLAATGNFCACGGWPPHMSLPSGIAPPLCRCSFTERRKYLERLSGPLLDRIDLCGIVVPEIPSSTNEPSPRLQERVSQAREKALKRWGALAGDLSAESLEALLREHPEWLKWIGASCASLRSRHKIIRVALSLCAWDARDEPGGSDFFEARLYRPEEALAANVSEKSLENRNTSVNEL
jgi:magnesium chelatase family protein